MPCLLKWLQGKCTPDKQRKVARWEHEDTLEAMQKHLDQSPEAMRLRQQTAEHPFRTLKSWMGYTLSSPRPLGSVSTKMRLHVDI